MNAEMEATRVENRVLAMLQSVSVAGGCIRRGAGHRRV